MLTNHHLQHTNYAEITGAVDEKNNPVNDIDSDPDATNGNDAGGVQKYKYR
ncbi:MAG: hypothetical protein IPL98_13155 [Saprospiraceae bacterium]|nr:hypothetical protein [Saprospiraceae bacterium]